MHESAASVIPAGRSGVYLVGEVRTRLASLPAESVQCVVTSPPYWGLRDYGATGQFGLESTPEEYVANMVEVFREVRRVLRKDGTLWLNLGDCYAGSGKGGNPDEGKQATNKGSQTVGVLYGKTGETARLAAVSNVSRRFTTAHSTLKPKDLVGIPWRVALALQVDGWYLRSDIIWSKPNPMPESVTDRPTKAHEYMFLLTKSATYYYDADAIREPAGANTHSRGRGTSPKNELEAELTGRHKGWGESTLAVLTERNKRSVWQIATQPYPEAHFATFPEKLVEPCILAGTKPQDVVLDPFAGSGTTLVVAKLLGRRSIGIDLNADYRPLFLRRLAKRLEKAARDASKNVADVEVKNEAVA